jgi:Family of unknown function (DUF6093)
MDRASLLARGRAAAERGMVDTCEVRRVTGQATDDFSGEIVKTYLIPDPYAGKCRLKQAQALPETHEAGEDYVILSRLELQLPVSAVGIQVGDEVWMTSSLNDPDLPGKVFVIRGPAAGSEVTARRFEVTERVA